MIKKFKLFTFLFILICLFVTGCTNTGGNTTDGDDDDIIEIIPNQEVVTIKDTDIEGYDFTKLFTIKVNGNKVPIKDEYVDSSSVLSKVGTYYVTCNYRENISVVEVRVTTTVYSIERIQPSVTVKLAELAGFDFKALFFATVDGTKVEITDDMVTNNISPKAGEYTYTVTFHGMKASVSVIIEDLDVTEIIPSYKEINLTVNELKDFDFTTLFAIYVNYEQIEITNDMIDTSSLVNPKAGNSYDVSITYQYKSNSIKINVVEEDEIKITSKNVFTYPSSEYIDLTSLFTIYVGDNEIPVTLDMISGSIDYSQIGINEIILTYQGMTATTTVEVKHGVIIDYAKSDTVVVVKGTNKNTYAFLNDFRVYINGILFNNISESYLDTSNVDFSTAGVYQATLKIPYNDNKLGLTSVKFTYYEKTINYVVVENEYTIKVHNDVVSLPKGTTSYKVYSNLQVTINGRNQALTENKNYVDVITCYVETLSAPIDFKKVGLQEVKIAIYANGVNNEPEIVTYQVIIESDVVITSNNKVIFSGDNLYPTELFTVKVGNKEVDVTIDMIEGYLNIYKAGKYTLTINYDGIIAHADVIVFDSAMKGTYKTDLDNVNSDTYGGGDEEETPVVTKVTDLVIGEDGSIMFNGLKATILSAIDEKTMLLYYRSYEYTMYYENGIIVLVPDNEIKLGYSYDKRPFIYFNENIWTIEDKVVVNFSDEHVLNMSYTSYSIDSFKLMNNQTDTKLWYGLLIDLIDKSNSDTVYELTWGEVEFSDNFEMKAGCKASVKLNNKEYQFTMTTNNVGKINKETASRLYANLTFTGTVDGKTAELRADQYEGYSFYVGGNLVFKVGSYDIGNMKNGGANYTEQEVLIYQFKDSIYSYKFSVDPKNLTFELLSRDVYFGLYQTENMDIFLDGYGSGEVNFNTKSYYRYPFTYTVHGDIIQVKFINTNSLFKYGEGFELYMNPLLNVITVIDADYEEVVGKVFENKEITNGAIINISSYKVGADADAVAKTKFLSNIEIITKDGVLDNTEKAKLIDLSKIKFSTPGFYQFTITIELNGESRVVYLGMEVLDVIYDNNPVVGAYGNGVLNQLNSLTIDKYGQALIDCAGNIYRGSTKIFDDLSFNITADNSEGKQITINGNYLANGLVHIRCNGDYSFSDYFTLGKVNVIGINKFVLREFKYGSDVTYILSNAATARGDIATVEILSGTSISQIGAIVKVSTETVEQVIKIVSWDNVINGLVLADEYRGTYTSDSTTIEIDGFGNAIVDGAKCTYMLNGSVATISSATETKVYKLYKDNYTYEILDIKLDNSLVSGKTFTANHTFTCGYGVYYAETTFTFGENGVVTVISTSSDHDNGDSACTDDIYSPSFASASGVKGTYSVSGNKVFINVAGYEIVLIIINVLNVNEMKCESTTIESDAHGHIASGTLFIKK